jgi:peptidoglycan/LPS O-acetylase OafA/YrhL
MTTDWTKNPLLVMSSYAVIVYAISNLSVAAPRLGEALGSASYPVYLLQWFTIPAIEKSWHFIHIDNSPIANALFLVGTLMATLTLGVAWDRFADRPISKATKTFLRGLKLRN